jgi:cytidylate kinase
LLELRNAFAGKAVVGEAVAGEFQPITINTGRNFRIMASN